MTTPKSGREAFEAWWGCPLHRNEDDTGYADRMTDAAWRAWQAALAQQGREVEVRLWDSQWVNVVNAPEVLNASDAEEAVRTAVRMTERFIAKNVADATLPPAAAPKQQTAAVTEEMVRRALHFCPSEMSSPQKWRWIAKFITTELLAALPGKTETTP